MCERVMKSGKSMLQIMVENSRWIDDQVQKLGETSVLITDSFKYNPMGQKALDNQR
jgi:hypothetical protein